MLPVLLVIHLMIAIALVCVVLLQRSEGGGLGIGGGGGGGFMTGRGTANALTRLTALLALGFFITSIGLTLLARFEHKGGSILDTIGKPAATAPVVPGTPATTAPATTAPATTAPATTAPATTAPAPAVPAPATNTGAPKTP